MTGPAAPPVPPLTAFERTLVLSCCPPGSRILSAAFFRHHAYPCPIEVVAELPDASHRRLVVRSVRHRKGHLEREVALYPVLAAHGLPVPSVLAGPAEDASENPPKPRLVLSRLPGVNLQELGEHGGPDLVRAVELVVDAIGRMHALSAAVTASPAAGVVPRGGLAEHLDLILAREGAWPREPLFREAGLKLLPVLRQITTPLVFSNGDYQPANFLAQDGRLSGVLDFEFAWFEDPLYGLAKYPIYDLQPLHGAGVVAKALSALEATEREFAPRLALGCMATLAREIEVEGGDPAYRRHVLGVLESSLGRI